jgi:hypothetical protein
VVRQGAEAFTGPLSPGETVFSRRLQHGFTQNPPITLAIDNSAPQITGDNPDQQLREPWPNLALTVYYLNNGRFFRIGVTNVSRQLSFEDFIVHWWALQP